MLRIKIANVPRNQRLVSSPRAKIGMERKNILLVHPTVDRSDDA